MRKLILIGIALLSTATTPTYRIRIAVNPEAGHRQRVSNETHYTQTVTRRDHVKRSVAYTDRITAVATMVRRDGPNATMQLQFVTRERESKQGHFPDRLQGKILNVTVRGDAITIFSSDGQPLGHDQRENLTGMIRTMMRLEASNVCTPSGPLSVGTTWSIPPEQAADCFNFSRDAKFGNPTGTLVAVDGGFAVIDYRFPMRVKDVRPLLFDDEVPVECTQRKRVSLTDPLLWTSTTTWHFSGVTHPNGPRGAALLTEVRATDVTQSAPADVASPPHG